MPERAVERFLSRKHRWLAPAHGLVVLIGIVCGCASSWAGDWPQILGPHRSGQAEGESLPARLNSQSSKAVWQREVGSGFAGVSVAGDTLALFHRRGEQLIAEALDAGSGKPRWTREFPTQYVSSLSPDDGPRAAPVIAGDDVYLFGPDGSLRSLDLATGRERWVRQTQTDFSPPEGYFGAGSSPLVEGELLLLNVGGRQGSAVVAFDRKSGGTRWKAFDDAASYSSPVGVTVDGVRHAIFVTRLNVVSLDPATGQVRFRFPFGKRGPTVNGANPVVVGSTLLVTASYGIGAQARTFSATNSTLIWESDEALSSQYVTPVERGGYLYGIDGRQDGPPARLRCVDLKTGKVRWTAENFGVAALIMSGDKLLAMKVDGELTMCKANPDQFESLGSVRLFESETVQALPALAGGRLYVRSEKLLRCFQL